MSKLKLCAALCALFLISAVAHAGTIDLISTGTGGTSNASNWNDPNTWTGGTGLYPNNGLNGNNYTATINSRSLISPAQNIAINSLSMNGGVLNVNGGSFSANSLSGSASNLSAYFGTTVAFSDISSYTGMISIANNFEGATLKLGSTTNNGFINFGPVATGTPFNSSLTAISGNETLINHGAISGVSGTISGFSLLSNTGTIHTSDSSGNFQPLVISTSHFSNSGTLSVDAGTALQINSAQFDNLTGGTLSGGTYNLGGRLTLNGNNITTLGPNTSVTLTGAGQIWNGSSDALRTLSLNQGSLNLVSSASETLTSSGLGNAGSLSVTLGAGLRTGFLQNTAGGQVVVGDTSTLNSRGLLNYGAVSLTGVLDARGGGLDSFQNVSSANELLTGGTWTLGANATLSYDAGTGAHGGAIEGIGTGTSLLLSRGGQVQYGQNSLDALANLSSNAGTLTLNSGTYNFTPNLGLLGTFDNAASGILQVNNTANATVNTFALSNEGEISVSLNGVLTSTGYLANHGTLNGSETSQINAGLGLSNDGSINIYGGTLSAASGTNSGALNVINQGNTATAMFTGQLTNTGTMTVGGTSHTGASDTISANTIENDGGTVNIDLDGTLLAGVSYTQTGGSTSIGGGTILTTNVSVRGGDVSGYGAIIGDTDNSGGTFDPNGGILDIEGQYTQDAGGTLDETLGGGAYLSVNGDLILSGMFDALGFGPGLSPQVGDSFEIVHFTGKLTGNFTSFSPSKLNGFAYHEDIEANDIRLSIDGLATSAAPEPSFFWLTGVVLGFLVVRAKRRACGLATK